MVGKYLKLCLCRQTDRIFKCFTFYGLPFTERCVAKLMNSKKTIIRKTGKKCIFLENLDLIRILTRLCSMLLGHFDPLEMLEIL